jgi:hypothetical protein
MTRFRFIYLPFIRVKKGVALGIAFFLAWNASYLIFTHDSPIKQASPLPERNIVWDVTMDVNETGGAFDYVIFGEAPDANDGPPADSYDMAKPPAPIPPYLRTWFNDSLPAPYDVLWRDYRHYPDTMKVWNLTVQWIPSDYTSPTTVTISWDPTPFDDCEYTIVTLYTEGGVPLKDMLLQTNYSFFCPANIPQNFKIVCLLNHAPNEPSNPAPANQTTGVSLTPSLSWTGGDPDGDPVTYDVFFGTATTPPKVASNQSALTYNPGTLDYSMVYYWKIIAWDNHSFSSEGPLWHFTTKANNPPVFGTPSPLNGSSGQPLSFTWSIPISDPEGDSFDWTIQCSNGDATGVTGAYNGTKSLPLSDLSYHTTYKVWVNATDPTGSDLYTKRWYTFTTKESLPPVFGTPTPANQSTGNPLNLTWSIPINDPEGDSFDWTIQCSNGQMTGAISDSNGTKTLGLTGLSYNTTYKVWVNATDPDGSQLYTRRWYLFTTKQVTNNPPYVPSNETPPSGAIDVSITTTLSWTGGDPDNDPVTYDVYCGTTTPPPIVSHNQSTTSYNPGKLASFTKYYWRIVAWDDHGHHTTGPLWNFTTEHDVTPPKVSLQQPKEGYIYLNFFDLAYLRIHFFMTIVIGKINVMVDASDNQSGVNRVEFWIDNDVRYTAYNEPYEWLWSETGIFQRTLKVVAYDNAGNHAQDLVTLWKIQFHQ